MWSLTLLLVVTPALAPVLAKDGVGHGGGSHGGSDGGESELHVVGWLFGGKVDWAIE